MKKIYSIVSRDSENEYFNSMDIIVTLNKNGYKSWFSQVHGIRTTLVKCNYRDIPIINELLEEKKVVIDDKPISIFMLPLI